MNIDDFAPTMEQVAKNYYDLLIGDQAPSPAQTFQRYQAGRFQDPRFRQAQYSMLPQYETAFELSRNPEFERTQEQLRQALAGETVDPATQEITAGGLYAELPQEERQARILQGGIGGEFRNPFERFLGGTYGTGAPAMNVQNLQNLITGQGGALAALGQTPAQNLLQAQQGGLGGLQEAARMRFQRENLMSNPYLQAQAAMLPLQQQTAAPFQSAMQGIMNDLYGAYMRQNPLGNFLQYAQAQNLGGFYA